MNLVIEVLIYAAALIALLSAWLMLRMKDEYQMMHFMYPPACLSVIFITAAIFLQNGRKPECFKGLFIVLIVLVMNSVVTHATARAFRIRETRDEWRPGEGENVPVLPSDEVLSPGSED
ncbi:MAG TPA: monovalent cation/H(+) antiporter subunit G [Terriglobales bacterium]|jgi:multisubunit Na+/H+ antiporter MnhG subunit|nr:monovalent cation/H(+) antiporter subunit G [Terriglobales bacterium]